MNYEIQSRSACRLKLEFIIEQYQYINPSMYHIKAAWQAAVSKNPPLEDHIVCSKTAQPRFYYHQNSIYRSSSSHFMRTKNTMEFFPVELVALICWPAKFSEQNTYRL